MKNSKSRHAWPAKDWYVNRWKEVNLNGFTHSFTPYQLAALLTIALPNITSMILIDLIGSISERVIVALGTGILGTISGILWYKTTSIDPSDSVQQRHIESIYE